MCAYIRAILTEAPTKSADLETDSANNSEQSCNQLNGGFMNTYRHQSNKMHIIFSFRIIKIGKYKKAHTVPVFGPQIGLSRATQYDSFRLVWYLLHFLFAQ